MKITKVKYIVNNGAINTYSYSLGLFFDTKETIAFTKLKMLYSKFKKNDPTPERNLTKDEKYELAKLVYETYHVKEINGEEKCFGRDSFIADWYRDELKSEYQHSGILEYVAYFNLFDRKNYDTVISMSENSYRLFRNKVIQLNENHMFNKERFEALLESYCLNAQKSFRKVSG